MRNDEWKPGWIFQRGDLQVNVQCGPMQVKSVKQLHLKDFTSRASLNQGNLSYGRKYSLSLTNTQSPLRETFVTSASEMLFPSSCDFIVTFLNDSREFADLFLGQPAVLRHRDTWRQPELCFTVRTRDVDMPSRFFTREEEESVPTVSEDCWTHGISNIPQVYSLYPVTSRNQQRGIRISPHGRATTSF